MKDKFLLNPEITYLNHGSFGACPKVVFEEYQNFQRKLEYEPVQHQLKNSLLYLQKSKEALANFIHCEVSDFFFTPNPTTAINIVMRSLKLNAGDEILATNQEYGSMDKTWKYYAKKNGVTYINQPISLPIQSKEQLLAEFWKGYTSHTKVVFINQMSSSTALLFPVQEIVQKANELGLITIIDGAHIPGHIALNLNHLQPDFYTGTCHKWMLTPKGSSFLYVAKQFQKRIDPLVISWGFESENRNFLAEQEYQGTNDYSAFFCLPKAIEFLQENHWEEKSKQCKQLIINNYKRFCDLVGTEPICPITEEFLGQMCSIPIQTNDTISLKELLYHKYKIEIPILPVGTQNYLRITIQAYNTQKELDYLYICLEEIKNTTDLLN